MNMQRADELPDFANEQLIAAVAHELRNPLMPIRNAAALLRHEPPDSVTIHRMVEVIERQVGEMHRLIGDLLDVSHIRQGPLILRRDVRPLSRLIELALKTGDGFVNDLGHTVAVSVSPETIYLRMDVARLCQAMRIILANAIKYTDRHGHIHVRAHREGGDAVILVSDTGVGIPSDDLERIFGLFAKSTQGGRVEPGLGIGLYLARQLVEAHGGTLTAGSPGVGLGAEFTIRMPCMLPTNGTFAGDAEASVDLSPA